jgi:PAS domain S-box-containing protein
MKLHFIPLASVLLQFLAAFLALRLIWITGTIASWILVAGAILLMAFRRCISLYGWYSAPSSPLPLDITFEIFGLLISIMMAVGLLLIVPLFRSLRRSFDLLRQQHRLILDAAGEGIFGVDLKGRVTFVNPAATGLCGYQAEELIGRRLHDVIHYARADGVPHPMEECPVYNTLKDGTIQRVAEDAFWKKDGESFPVEYTATPIMENNRVIGTTVVFKDITARKAQEEELARSNQELEQFAYVASHDLQEPLRMVASFTQLLGKRYRGQLDSDADEFISYAVDGANRMQQLLNDLLAYSRVGTRGKPLVPVDSNSILNKAMANLAYLIEDSGAVITHLPLPRVQGDEVQLIQLFQNLLINAIKFRGRELPMIQISAERKGSDWKFSVQDNGIGIASEHQERIFIIFQRLHQRADYPGTGIGLALCKKIVQRHGGRIWVKSALEQGATFCFTLKGAENGGN